MPGSANRLPLDHPTMKLYLGDGSHRTLQQQQQPSDDGFGYCVYTNPFTSSDTCVQLTGAAWGEDGEAESWCASGGPMPGVRGKFSEGRCPAFTDPDFGGVCVTAKGEDKETVTAFASGPDAGIMGSCEAIVPACSQFAQGVWEARGGKCAGEDDTSAEGAVVGGGDTPGQAGVCKLQGGIAGGGHMDRNSAWSLSCPNANSSYSYPLRWTAVHIGTSVQKPAKKVGTVWYDLANKRRREDSYLEEGDLQDQTFRTGKNMTFIHEGPFMYLINWDNMTCTNVSSPVGILRPNWIIDSEGFKAESQFLGTEYMMYEGRWLRVKKWRKTEPLEDAFMVQAYDDESVWSTPEGEKRRPIVRMTPGAPFEGDTVDTYHNHSTEFDDSVFDVYKQFECKPRSEDERRDSLNAFNDIQEAADNATAEGGGSVGGGGASGLNMNSSLHVDSSFITTRCLECDITYPDSETEDETDEIDEGSVAGSDAPAIVKSAAFSGTRVLRQEPELEASWSYSTENNTLVISLSAQTANWFALAFPEEECAMSPADSAIAIPAGYGTFKVNSYALTSRSMSGVQVANEDLFTFSAASQSDGAAVLTLHRAFPDGFPDEPISVTWALGEQPALSYHGIDNKGCFFVGPGAGA